jgi:chorismate mutase/prephenate dehydratase
MDNDDNKKPQQLDDVRARIDKLDCEIQRLISERAGLAFQVVEAKGETGNAIDYYRPEREAQVLRSVVDRNDGPLSDTEMLRLFREIMSACLAQQEPLKVAYLGPEGTFTQQAVNRHFGHSVLAISMGSIDAVFRQVQSGEADFGVVPVENSSQGAVSHTLDMFLDSELKICGEVELRIHQNLLTHAASLAQVERVYSHQQSLSQCQAWLRSHLPQSERIAVSSNAEAARRVKNAPEAAAIASRAAAKVYGIPILFADIEDQPDNTTRFLIIGRELLPVSGDDKTTLMLANRTGPGALYALLEPLSRMNIDMTRIESRPSRFGKWDYVFFIDIAGHVDSHPVNEVLAELEKTAHMVKVLGSYPRAVLTDHSEQDKD